MNRCRKKYKNLLDRLSSYKPQEVVESIDPAINVDEPETLEKVSKFVRTYEFNGRLGTISSVPHTKAEMTLAKANDEMPEAFPIRAWQDSRYYFYGKGAAGHHCAISHVYSEPTRTKSE
ncbi:ribonuclease E [Haemophilus influenzae]|uniref:Ribonuclease E n=1 Tax=Haemophilus influenzae TaxID=727 RepID=A0A2X1PP69_HAEIF|nr:ribonuclease E [Haemophilus influenzae]